MENRLTRMLKIRYPIAMGGMAGVTDGCFAASVSEAGGLGTIAAMKESAESLAREIVRLRELTDKPFAVNVPLMVPHTPELIEVVLESSVPVVITAAGNPAMYAEKLQAAGIRVIHVVPCVDQARKAEKAGVDAVIAEGFESGGFASPMRSGPWHLYPRLWMR